MENGSPKGKRQAGKKASKNFFAPRSSAKRPKLNSNESAEDENDLVILSEVNRETVQSTSAKVTTQQNSSCDENSTNSIEEIPIQNTSPPTSKSQSVVSEDAPSVVELNDSKLSGESTNETSNLNRSSSSSETTTTPKSRAAKSSRTPSSAKTPEERKRLNEEKEKERKRIQEEKEKERQEKLRSKQEEKDRKERERLAEKERKEAEKEKLRLERERKLNEQKAQRQLAKEQEEIARRAKLLEKEEERARKAAERFREKEEKERAIQQKVEEKRKAEEAKKEKEEKQKIFNFFQSVPAAKTNVEKSDNSSNKENKDSLPDGYQFRGFELKTGMSVAFIRRRSPVSDIPAFDEEIRSQDQTKSTYLSSVPKKRKLSERSVRLRRQKSIEVISPNASADRPTEVCSSAERAKLLQFHTDHRPPYYGTWRKTSGEVSARRPFGKDSKHMDYEVDSEAEWEEEPEGDECDSGDDEDEDMGTENSDDEEDKWMVDHGYLSEGEGCDEDEEDMAADPEARRKIIAAKSAAWKSEKLCKKWKKLVPAIYYDFDNPVHAQKLASFEMYRPACSLVTTEPDIVEAGAKCNN